MLDFFPEYVSPALDKRKLDITLEHLLTMGMGIAGEHENYLTLYYSKNRIKSVIEMPLEYSPGVGFSYNTFETHLLSAIITKTSGMNTFEFGRKYLFEPLSVTVTRWERGPDGYYFGGNNMFMTARDMARLGYLYLNGGFLDGKQIVSQDWVERSLEKHITSFNQSWGDLRSINYGYLWWLGRIKN